MSNPNRAHFAGRMRPSVKARLDEAAAANGRSVSEETEARLEASFDRLEALFGGPAGLRFALMMVDSFAEGAARQAADKGHPEWEMAEWQADGDCFEEGLIELLSRIEREFPS